MLAPETHGWLVDSPLGPQRTRSNGLHRLCTCNRQQPTGKAERFGSCGVARQGHLTQGGFLCMVVVVLGEVRRSSG